MSVLTETQIHTDFGTVYKLNIVYVSFCSALLIGCWLVQLYWYNQKDFKAHTYTHTQRGSVYIIFTNSWSAYPSLCLSSLRMEGEWVTDYFLSPMRCWVSTHLAPINMSTDRNIKRETEFQHVPQSELLECPQGLQEKGQSHGVVLWNHLAELLIHFQY